MKALIKVLTSFIRRQPQGQCRSCTIQSQRERGFSTLELVVVSALAITVTTIALPQMVQMRSNFNLQGDLRVVQVAIQTARYNAIAQGRQYRIVFQSNPAPQMQIQADSSANPQDPLHTPTWTNQGGPIPLSRGIQFVNVGNLICDFSGGIDWVNSTLEVSTVTGERHVALTNGARIFDVSISRLLRVRVIQIS